MANRWRDLDTEEKKYINSEVEREISNSRKLADDAFTRKSKFLTASNAGGVVTIVSYLGAFKPELDWFILSALILFLLGMTLNGVVMFLAEHRYNSYLDGQLTLTASFARVESEMTVEEYNNQINELHKSVDIENLMEITSAICFLMAVVIIVSGMIIKIC
jgi:hypothetical protein